MHWPLPVFLMLYSGGLFRYVELMNNAVQGKQTTSSI